MQPVVFFHIGPQEAGKNDVEAIRREIDSELEKAGLTDVRRFKQGVDVPADGTEWPTIEQLYKFCVEIEENTPVIYLHTKGANHPPKVHTHDFVQDWRRWMLYFVVEKWENALEALKKPGVAAVGCFLTSQKYVHFSGNYWMAWSHALRELPPPREVNQTGTMGEAQRAEAWHGQLGMDRMHCLFMPPVHPYKGRCPREMYAS